MTENIAVITASGEMLRLFNFFYHDHVYLPFSKLIFISPCSVQKVKIKKDWKGVIENCIYREQIDYYCGQKNSLLFIWQLGSSMKALEEEAWATRQSLGKRRWHSFLGTVRATTEVPGRCLMCDVELGLIEEHSLSTSLSLLLKSLQKKKS